MAARMQAGRQLVARPADHRAVIADVAAGAVGVLGDDGAVGDVGAAIGGEVPQHRQRREVDVAFLDDLGDGAGLHLARRHRGVAARLIGRVQLRWPAPSIRAMRSREPKMLVTTGTPARRGRRPSRTPASARGLRRRAARSRPWCPGRRRPRP